MIICIAGLSGSGKNTVAQLVADKLCLRLVNPTFKTLAKQHSMSLMEFQAKAAAEHSIDRKFDSALLRETKKGNCVVCTWLGPWMVKKADLRVWLYAPRQVRAERLAGREGISAEEALRHITERDEENHARYREVYGIDIYDHSGFELVVNTEKYGPEESASIIVSAAIAKGATVGKKGTPAKKTKKKKAAKKAVKKKKTVSKKAAKKAKKKR
jgi:cytidylate kinase